MNAPLLLIGCHAPIEAGIRADHLAQLHSVVSLPDLRRNDLVPLVRQAALVILHEQAAPRDLPQICHHLRRHTNRPLMVMLTSQSEAAAAAVLEQGADDCLGPNISSRELVARIRAHLRRDQEYSAPNVPVVCEVGELRLDTARHEVLVRGQPVNLTPREFELLECLAGEAGRAVPREELLHRVWGYSSGMSTRTLDVHIGRVRQKVERNPATPQMIVTIPGVGYKLAC